MISVLLSRVIILVLGTLYPAYASFKAVRTKNVKEYVKWMMYWIVFALFTCIETFADMFLAFWMPFYYELKIVFILWLLAPATKGASILYRKFVHPRLVKHEEEIDSYIVMIGERGYSAIIDLGSRLFSYFTNAVVSTAIKGQSKLAEHMKKSYSLSDVREDEADGDMIDRQAMREGFVKREELEDEDEYDFEPEMDSNRMVDKFSAQRQRSEKGDSERDLYPEEDTIDGIRLRQTRIKKTTYSHKEVSHMGTLPRSTRTQRSRPPINTS